MITTELRDDVFTVAMDDGKANTYDFERFAAFHAAMDEAEKARARAVVFKGRERIFSGGLNTRWIPTLDREGMQRLGHEFASTMLRVYTLPIPTVAQVTGHAIAGGCILACACDRRLGLAGDFKLQMNEHLIRMALPGWARLICESSFPRPQVEDLLLLAQPFSPAQAKAVGTLHDVAPDPGALEVMCREAARELTELDPRSFAISKTRARKPAADAALEVAASGA